MNRTFAFTAIALLSAGATLAAARAVSSTPVVVSIGDSIAYEYGLPSRSTQNYAAVYDASIRGKLVNLGNRDESRGDNFIGPTVSASKRSRLSWKQSERRACRRFARRR